MTAGGNQLSRRVERHALSGIQLLSAFLGFTQGFRIIPEAIFLLGTNPADHTQPVRLGKFGNRILYFLHCLHDGTMPS